MKRKNQDAAMRASAAISEAERALRLSDRRMSLLAHARAEYGNGNYARAAREARALLAYLQGPSSAAPTGAGA